MCAQDGHHVGAVEALAMGLDLSLELGSNAHEQDGHGAGLASVVEVVYIEARENEARGGLAVGAHHHDLVPATG